jgi:MFS family permease
MSFLRKYGFDFLLLGALSDFLTPYVLGIFYPQLDQQQQVISAFGDVNSPVQHAFFIWSVVSGLLIVGALPALAKHCKAVSKKIAACLCIALGVYGIGDCIFTGLFSIDAQESVWRFSTWVHNIGSGIGYMGFLISPALFAWFYQRAGNQKQSRSFFLLFLVSIFFAAIYGLARLPQLSDLPVLNQLGLCQRISFFFNYLPIVLFFLQQRKRPDDFSRL